MTRREAKIQALEETVCVLQAHAAYDCQSASGDPEDDAKIRKALEEEAERARVRAARLRSGYYRRS